MHSEGRRREGSEYNSIEENQTDVRQEGNYGQERSASQFVRGLGLVLLVAIIWVASSYIVSALIRVGHVYCVPCWLRVISVCFTAG